jgi:hypothetical protein
MCHTRLIASFPRAVNRVNAVLNEKEGCILRILRQRLQVKKAEDRGTKKRREGKDWSLNNQ